MIVDSFTESVSRPQFKFDFRNLEMVFLGLC